MLDVFAVALDGGAEERGGIGVAADEFCCGREGEIHEVVEDEDLAVAVGTGADADGGDGQRGGDLRRRPRGERLPERWRLRRRAQAREASA